MGVHQRRRNRDSRTVEQPDAWLLHDLAVAERIVKVLNVPLTQLLYDALVSLAFNTGILGETIPAQCKKGDSDCLADDAQELKQNGTDLVGRARRYAKAIRLLLDNGIPR